MNNMLEDQMNNMLEEAAEPNKHRGPTPTGIDSNGVMVGPVPVRHHPSHGSVCLRCGRCLAAELRRQQQPLSLIDVHTLAPILQ